MAALWLILTLLALTCEAKPSWNALSEAASDSPSFGGRIIGGSASTQTWGWQLSLERLSGSTWSHSCGAVLLQATKALTAAHCVDGTPASGFRVIAGTRDRNNLANAQTSNVDHYIINERFKLDAPQLSNDIAILTFETPISTNANVFFATLPPNNNNQYAGQTCIITGWGQVSSSSNLPAVLQQASIQVITTADCQFRLSQSGEIWDNQICVYSTLQNVSPCGGDDGGPLNCPGAGSSYTVTGLASWFSRNALGNCVQNFPSVFTRTSAYLDWINTNLPK